MSEQEMGRRARFVSLRLKFLLGFTLLFSIVFAGAFYWFYTYATDMAMEQIRDDMVNTLRAGVAGINGDEFAALATEAQPNQAGASDDPRYQKHMAWLETIHSLEPRANPYTYIQGSQPNEVLFIGDILRITAPEKATTFREPYVSEGVMTRGFEGLWEELGLYDDPWGSWISAYAPIRNAAGEPVGALGIDFRADYVRRVQQSILDKVLIAFAITYVTLFVLVFLVSGALTRPTLALTQAAEQVAQGDYEQDIARLYSGRLRDEISTLAHVFDLMVSKVREREESLKRQVQELRIEIDEVRKAKQVAEITETEYFQELRTRARTLRELRERT